MSLSVERLKSIKHHMDTSGFWIRPSVNGILSFLVKLNSVNGVSGQDLSLFRMFAWIQHLLRVAIHSQNKWTKSNINHSVRHII